MSYISITFDYLRDGYCFCMHFCLNGVCFGAHIAIYGYLTPLQQSSHLRTTDTVSC